MRFWKLLKKLLISLIIFFLLLYILYVIFIVNSVHKQPEIDAKIENFEVILWEDMLPINMNIPVRYVGKEKSISKTSCLKTKENQRIYFGKNSQNPKEFLIYKTTFFSMGTSVKAYYVITDPEVAKQLIELYKTKPFEVLLAEKREREKAEAEKAEKTEKKPTSTESSKPTETPVQ